MTLTLGKRIRALREARDWSLSDLARESGISRQYLHQLEQGNHKLTIEKMQALANAFGVLIAELSGEIDSFEDLYNLPESLKEFARKHKLPSADVKMLSEIHYHGRKPDTEVQWSIIYSVIKSTLGK